MIRTNTPKEIAAIIEAGRKNPNKIIYINACDNPYNSGWFKRKAKDFPVFNESRFTNSFCYHTLKYPKILKRDKIDWI